MSDSFSAVPGLKYIADWLAADACRDLLSEIDAAEWSAQLKRRVQHYGRRYDYGRRSVAGDGRDDAPPLPPWAHAMAARLADEGLMDREAEQVIVNEYLPGQGISAHVDCVPASARSSPRCRWGRGASWTSPIPRTERRRRYRSRRAACWS
ncbi:hypothetical protein O4J56_16830 [Nocardiopsis sp. RSe5-2]|uniref:Alpha-ketoglutarate-dependent dioxygenase AlkB-like domain-containing protein n=1 Tax=Nocardiopsis endophytica TaxID=3018445 RepID=A0ABT4U5T7_9ACTN|nr:hypothetical protein [Nocardiopsis endophytica]MDA2812309.1 hypothetical protein [Nocardiopsis endophytica]